MPRFHWRAARTDDLEAIIRIAEHAHPDFPEDRAIFAERLALYPAGARLLEVDGAAAGYAICHPWAMDSLPALNTLLGALPANPATLYLHDLALLPAARGTGAGRMAADHLAAHAQSAGFASMTLVAVNQSVPFWERMGFAVVEAKALADKLESYGDDARMMIRTLES